MPKGRSCWAGILRTRWCGRKGGTGCAADAAERQTQLRENSGPAAGGAATLWTTCFLSCTVRIPEIQAYIQEQAGVSVSESTVSRYGKRLAESYRDLIVAQEKFEALRKEVEKYPEQDAAEVLLRIAIHKMMLALTSKTEKD